MPQLTSFSDRGDDVVDDVDMDVLRCVVAGVAIDNNNVWPDNDFYGALWRELCWQQKKYSVPISECNFSDQFDITNQLPNIHFDMNLKTFICDFVGFVLFFSFVCASSWIKLCFAQLISASCLFSSYLTHWRHWPMEYHGKTRSDIWDILLHLCPCLCPLLSATLRQVSTAIFAKSDGQLTTSGSNCYSVLSACAVKFPACETVTPIVPVSQFNLK